MRQFIARELRRAHRKIHATNLPLVIATSGTAAALVEAIAAAGKTAKRPRRTSGRGTSLSADLAGMAPTDAVRKLAAKLAKMTLPEREAVPGIGPRRSEIIVAGAQVFAELLESFGLKGFQYSPLGLRDGILAQMLAEQDARAAAHRELEQERWHSVLVTAKRYGVDPRQAEPQMRRAAPSAARMDPQTMTTGVANVKLSRPARLTCRASHSSNGMGLPMCP